MAEPALTGGAVWRLGVGQLINWGTSFYLLGAYGQAMVAGLGWSSGQVFAGLSVAMVVMGLVSPLTGSLIERFGARPVLCVGTLINALCCALLALLPLAVGGYYAIWALLGVGMRLSLYDALFATLAARFGEAARPLCTPAGAAGGAGVYPGGVRAVVFCGGA